MTTGHTLVAGVDSSTQSTKVVVCHAATGEVVRRGVSTHPDGTEVPAEAWWTALTTASAGLLDGVVAISVAAQQHGMVTVDDRGDLVRPALLWNDTRSATAAADLVAERGGPQAWAQDVGSVPVASFTVTKLRWFAEHESALAARTAGVMLPHDWLTWRLRGGTDWATTDRGDASGTGYWSPQEGRYRLDLLKLAFGRDLLVPRVVSSAEPAGLTSTGVIVAAGTGDNMAAALGLGVSLGDVVVSLGTSGTAVSVSEVSSADRTGVIAGFADATGRFLPLVCTLNAARVLSATASLLGTDITGLDKLALSATPGAAGVVMLPYLEGERTPNLPAAAGSLHGLRRGSMSPENIARAAVEGMLCGLADGVDALRMQGIAVRRILLTGGAARSSAVRAVAAQVLGEGGVPVVVPEPAEYVALGAARQAAWALSGAVTPPRWLPTPNLRLSDSKGGAAVRGAYQQVRYEAYGV
jgi:xylulokinase